MTRKGLSRDLALRIGLAANAFPEIQTGTLVELLTSLLEMPLTRKKLESLTQAQLQKALQAASLDAAPSQLEQAMQYLHGVEGVSPRFPEPEAADPDAKAIHVAIASNGDAMLDGHFASCSAFLVYQLSADSCRLIDVRHTDGAAASDDKTAWLVALIHDCHLLYVASVGGPAAAKVIKAGIHPIKVAQACSSTTVLDKLQQVLASSPPPWLAKVMGVAAEERSRLTREDAT